MTYKYFVNDIWDLPRELRERHATYSFDPDEPRFSIYCNESSHEGDPWFVASFEKENRSGSPEWVWSYIYPTTSGSAFWIGANSKSELVGDRPIDESEVNEAVYQEGFRVRYELECGKCGLRQEARPEKLKPVLDTLWSYDIRELNLKTFAARLG